MSENKFFDIAQDLLWADFIEESSFPKIRPLLAHYTSISTLEKIVTAGEFWLSNPLFMNDLEELKFGMNEGASEFLASVELKNSCGEISRYEKLINSFQQLFNDFDSNHALNTYVLCFSEHRPDDNDGLLSMWRGYGDGGSGAAIVINTEKLNSVDESPLILGKVDYKTKQERVKWINQHISILSTAIDEHAKTDEDLFWAAEAWIERLKIFSIFSKHSGFHEEQEWRLVYMSERDKEQKLNKFFGHLATHKGIEPKLKLPIQPIDGITDEGVSLEKIVDRIILGPSIASTLGVNALKQMLRNIGREPLADRVIASDIPFRSN